MQEQTKSLLAEDENKGTCYFQLIERNKLARNSFKMRQEQSSNIGTKETFILF